MPILQVPDETWTREYQDGELVPGTPYKVVCLLGAGGMGSVYIVEHIELGRHYVLKSLLRTLSTRGDLIARMRNEWRSLGALRHPNIVDVINAGATRDGVPYYIMELLNGETVRDRLSRVGRLELAQAVRIAQATLLGLAAAHAISVVHRDVKPANVFLTRDGGVKVLDFGIAQVRVEGAPIITAQGLAIGTPRYMSPEQASGEKADARSDVYAVGLLLYEMLTGEGPFDDLSDITQQMLAHLHRPPRPLRLWIDLPTELEDIILRALAKDPKERPRSAEYMAAELAPFAGTGGIDASPVPGSVLPISAPISSPTPSGTVINTTPPLRVKLSPEWHELTVERSSRPAPAPLLDMPMTETGRARVFKRRIVGIGLGAALLTGVAVVALGPTSPYQAAGAGVIGNAAPATLATVPPEAPGTGVVNPSAVAPRTTADAPSANTAIPSPITPKPGLRKTGKRPARPEGVPAAAGERPVRLPVSGL